MNAQVKDVWAEAEHVRPLNSWKEFEKHVRVAGYPLLGRLDEFKDSILVAGCQRSGTTMLAKVITESEGIRNFWFGVDPCMDGGLLLSGYLPHEPEGRYCFQTTHVDEKYEEYLAHSDYRMIWCLRNPRSVVYSLVYNWSSWGLNVTFDRCGLEDRSQSSTEALAYKVLGPRAVSRIERGCHIYNVKVQQIFELKAKLPAERLAIVDYDELVRHKQQMLPAIYEFIDLDYQPAYADKILETSIDKASRLNAKEVAVIDALCQPIYERARDLRTLLSD
jgi:hypothetical protein